MMVTIKILFFAGIADVTQHAEETWQLSAQDNTVQDIIQELIEKYGDEFRQLISTCMYAINMEYVSQMHPVAPFDELAIIPPVSGG
ncbi:Molybdopterin converting factor, subunit 1 [Hesseltinella vesiculosa]|uniref:Molybdopterin converting factor, subunit 1 n=1 Tax=Hesseltinella vesiculosa TaxID=101127 RepID=A0A1X2G7Q3_9FUNG|nr:Molybdopterin converting factor, subunit 1 [Hesseltinella vesiculosa]